MRPLVTVLVTLLAACDIFGPEEVCEVRDFTVYTDASRPLASDTTVTYRGVYIGTYSFAVDSVTSVVVGKVPVGTGNCQDIQ